MISLETKLNQVRPRLSLIAPMTNYLCWCFVAINIFLGLGMYFLYSTPVPIAVASILSYQQWGVIFFLMGLVTAYGLIKNNWAVVRGTQVAGLFVKSTWLIALIVRCFIEPRSILITVIWAFLAAVQLGVYVYFFPPRTERVEGHVG